MIVTTGRIIKIDAGSLRLERSCETPGAVFLIDRDGKRVTLPVNEYDREMLIGAYRRACAESIEYREMKNEKAPPEPEGEPYHARHARSIGQD